MVISKLGLASKKFVTLDCRFTPMSKSKNIRTITFDGGCLCFDFINTVEDRTEASPKEYLKEYNDLLVLFERLELFDKQQLSSLKTYADRHVVEAGVVLTEAITLRENLYQLFAALAADKAPAPDAVRLLNGDLSLLFSHLEFRTADAQLELRLQESPTDLYLPMRRVLQSVLEVLQQQEIKRIKQCSGCGWLFLDQSKNNSRLWCDMQSCGSMVKAKRYYHRKKAKSH